MASRWSSGDGFESPKENKFNASVETMFSYNGNNSFLVKKIITDCVMPVAGIVHAALVSMS